MGAVVNQAGSVANEAQATMRAIGLRAWAVALPSSITTRASAPPLIQGAVAGLHRPALLEGRFQSGKLFKSDPLGLFILLDNQFLLRPLRARHRDDKELV